MKDLTVIMTTANRVPEKWALYHKKVLLEAIGDTPLITISFKPLDFGKNLLQKEYGVVNLYRQLLRGAKEAKTPYIAIAEDDILYPKEHFEFRSDKVGYDLNRWMILAWGEPFYFHKPHIANCGLVAPRKLFVEALEERFNKFGDKLPSALQKEVGRNKYERAYRIKQIPVQIYYSRLPFLCFAHVHAVDPNERHRHKKVWPVQAYDIPKWGKAKEMREKFV